MGLLLWNKVFTLGEDEVHRPPVVALSNIVNYNMYNGVIQILAAIFCPLVTCSNVPAISFHNILINLQYNFQNLNDNHFSQMVLSTCN